jgi:hypothetical protein
MIQQELYLAERVMEGLGHQIKKNADPVGIREGAGARHSWAQISTRFVYSLPNCQSALRTGPQPGYHFRRKALTALCQEI